MEILRENKPAERPAGGIGQTAPMTEKSPGIRPAPRSGGPTFIFGGKSEATSTTEANPAGNQSRENVDRVVTQKATAQRPKQGKRGPGLGKSAPAKVSSPSVLTIPGNEKEEDRALAQKRYRGRLTEAGSVRGPRTSQLGPNLRAKL